MRKSHTTPYHPQANGVVERGNRDLGDKLHSMLLGRDEEDWDLLLPQIMRTIRASLHKQTSETANFTMLGRETRLPEHLMYGPAADGNSSRESYAAELANHMEAAHDKLRAQQLQIRTGYRHEEPLFKVGQLVWLRTKHSPKPRAISYNQSILGLTKSRKQPETTPTSLNRMAVEAERRRVD